MEILPPSNSMEQSPSWDAKKFSASQEIPRILRNTQVHYLIHKCRPTIPILSSPVHFSLFYFLKIHFNYIFPSTLRSFKWSSSFGSPYQNPVCTTPFPRTWHMPSLSHSSWFGNPYNILWKLQSIKIPVMHSSPLSCHLRRGDLPHTEHK
jgi:hypothetical protein